MAKNVYIKHNNEMIQEQLQYIEELKKFYNIKRTLIHEQQQKIHKYKELEKKLEDVHKEIKHNILIPITECANNSQPLCFIDGQIIHTNEVFMPIGTTYYTKISNTEALNMCSKKIEDFEDELEELEDDKKKVLGKIIFLEESALQQGQVEIIEEYDEDAPEARGRRGTARKGAQQQTPKVEPHKKNSNLVDSDFKDGVIRGG